MTLFNIHLLFFVIHEKILPTESLFMPFCKLLIFFFSKSSFSKILSVSNSLDPNHARRFVGPDLGTNCLQRLSADDTSR